MAEVVTRSTALWRPEDRHAVAVYLKSRPAAEPSPSAPSPSLSSSTSGAALYALRCAPCHGAAGEGVPGLFPSLRANASVAGDPASLLRIVLFGARAAATPARPTGPAMPPVGAGLSDREVAAILSFVRAKFGAAAPVEAAEVAAVRKEGAPGGGAHAP